VSIRYWPIACGGRRTQRLRGMTWYGGTPPLLYVEFGQFGYVPLDQSDAVWAPTSEDTRLFIHEITFEEFQ